MVFGTAFDGACLLFEERCGSSGTCLFYDNTDMALYLFIVVTTVKAASLLFVVIAWKTYKPPKKVQKAIKTNMTDSKHVISKDREVVNGYTVYNGNVGHSNDLKGIASPVFVDHDGISRPIEEVTRF